MPDLPPDAEDMLLSWLDEFDLPPGVAQGYPTWPIRQALAWIAERRRLSPRLVELFVTTFFREVATYLRVDQARKTCRGLVADTISAHRADVVIAHSLGSVVAYEALWHHQDLKIDLLVTLGSPLALPHAVFARLDPAHSARPPGVARWVNIADPGDLVALPPKGISRRFEGVDADDSTVIHAFDFHLAANYLACRPLASELMS